MGYKLILAFSVFLSGGVYSHSLMPADMSAQEKQQMMEVIAKLQMCTSKIDSHEIETLQKRSNKFASDLRALCVKGEREQASKNTREFYREMMKNDAVTAMKMCSDTIPALFQSYLKTPLDLSQFDGHGGGHVCDDEILPVDQFGGHHH